MRGKSTGVNAAALETAAASQTAGAGAAGAAGSVGSSLSKSALLKAGLKSAGKVGGIGTAVALGMNLLEGKSTQESIGRALITGAGTFLGGAVGSLIPGAGTLAGGILGGFGGDYIGDLVYGSPAAQQYETAAVTAAASAANTATMQMDSMAAIATLASKIDTTNALLTSLNQKPNSVTIELDGEKIGKSVTNYSSETYDRNRSLNNTYGVNQSYRPRN